jgi:putative photosynthetic complex assembly protein
MSSHDPLHANEKVPRLPLLAAWSLVILALVGVAWQSWFAEPDPGRDALTAGVPATHVRDLRFSDRDDGAVTVHDAKTGELLDVIEVGEGGFIRATLRGLARERRLRKVGVEAPFRVQRQADGRLFLIDMGTSRHIDLWAFGAVNAQSFTRYLQRDTQRAVTADDAVAMSESG